MRVLATMTTTILMAALGERVWRMTMWGGEEAVTALPLQCLLLLLRLHRRSLRAWLPLRLLRETCLEDVPCAL